MIGNLVELGEQTDDGFSLNTFRATGQGRLVEIAARRPNGRPEQVVKVVAAYAGSLAADLRLMKSAPDKKVYASFFERNTDYTDTRVILPVTSSASLVGLTKGQPGEVINLRSNGITRPEGALVGLVAGLALSQADELTGQGVMYSVTAVASS